MRKMIFAKRGHWLTQSDLNHWRPRVFLKMIPVNYPKFWKEVTDEEKQAYVKEHGEPGPLELFKYYRNFDYSSTGGFFGEVNKNSK